MKHYIAALLMLLSASATPADIRVQVKDSGYVAHSTVGLTEKAVAWIDDTALLFSSAGPGKPVGNLQADGLYVWNVSSGRVHKHVSLPGNSQSFCYASGYLRYWYRDETQRKEFAGPLGKEEEVVVAKHPSENEGRRLNWITCRYYRDSDLPNTEDFVFDPLRQGDGYIGNGRGARKTEVIYLPEGTNNYVVLPIRESVRVSGYSQFAKRYILGEIRRFVVITESRVVRIWSFDPLSEAVTPATIPSGRWLLGSIPYIGPARHGLVFSSHATGVGGIYVVAAGKAQKVLAGYPYSTAVSPDGCKIATSIGVQGVPATLPPIKVIDTCRGDR